MLIENTTNFLAFLGNAPKLTQIASQHNITIANTVPKVTSRDPATKSMRCTLLAVVSEVYR